MAISLEQLEGYLLQEDFRYVIDDERIMLSFAMDDYVRPESGEKSLVVGIRVADEGRYAEICLPRVYDARMAVDAGRLAELLLNLGYDHRAVRFGLDRSDGEVRATVSFDPGDGTVTRQAFITALRWLPAFIDFWHPVIDRAIKTGELPGVDRIGGHPEIARLIAQAGGVERFLEMASRPADKPAAGGLPPGSVPPGNPAAGGASGGGAPAGGAAKPRLWRGWRNLMTSLFST